MPDIQLIKNLRDKTGAGMVDCQRALEESQGDMDKAVEILRKKGIAKAAKRAERVAKEGVIKIIFDEAENKGYIVEINAETDFVVKSERFQKFVADIVEVIKNFHPVNHEALMAAKLSDGQTIAETLDGLVAVVGEKMEVRRYEALGSAGTVAVYSHPGERVGVLLAIDKPGMKDLTYDLAMQVAAMNPKYVASADVLPEEIEKEKEIYCEQLKNEGKPEAVRDKIIEGKLGKFYSDVCLVNQPFIKDEEKTVEQLLKDSGDVKVEKFYRFSL